MSKKIETGAIIFGIVFIGVPLITLFFFIFFLCIGQNPFIW